MKKNEVAVTEEKEVAVLKMSKEAGEKCVAKINNELTKMSKGYINIAGDVVKLRDSKYYVTAGYKNMYDFAQAELDGMSRGTVSNLCNIVRRFGENYKIKAEWAGYNVRALMALKDLTDEQIALLDISPDMPALDIVKLVNEILNPKDLIEDKSSTVEREDEAKESDAGSTTATEEKINKVSLLYTVSLSDAELAEMVRNAFYNGADEVVFTTI